MAKVPSSLNASWSSIGVATENRSVFAKRWLRADSARFEIWLAVNIIYLVTHLEVELLIMYCVLFCHQILIIFLQNVNLRDIY